MTVSRKPPDAGEAAWERLGVTPIENRRLARGAYVWRFEKPGYATTECLAAELPLGPAVWPVGGAFHLTLDATGAAPPSRRPRVPRSRAWRRHGRESGHSRCC